jgi:hypothetical protein
VLREEMRKVAGGLMVARLAFWLRWIALLQGTALHEQLTDCSLAFLEKLSVLNSEF